MTARVAEVMLRSPIVLDGEATVADVQEVLASPHVHMVLLTGTGRVGEQLLGTLVRRDLAAAGSGEQPALAHAVLEGRTIGADLPAEQVRRAMRAVGERRVAVVDRQGLLVGLLCLKRHGGGFCTDAGVASRRAERTDGPGAQASRT
ncbi:CBS domain-containing protein [Nocardioides sp. zg-1228]|uniref:CBS domain-containing protein n=1 Tax=Nocardioides sp. zg-1228 TaxID=2763008 RepID=UPI0016429C35|nr:CBS domain-containing protein [Nocardioides sp. zg-1228]MBC2935037.1 CBS domain-containing protein [Nocardioides sp. zg-1228]QSF59006.1 CBS domain-containing protein [Nocardioides sp. zg-1228]